VEPHYHLFRALLGGSMFGQSFYDPDTTIAATQSLGCDLKINSKSIFYCISRSDYHLIFYLGLNSDIVTVDPKVGFEWIPIIPYILVIALALFGVNVFYFNYWDGFSRCHL
jgi:hypothetical protein